MSTLNMIVPEVLTKYNYEFWKTFMKIYLVGQGFWDIVDGIERKPEDTTTLEFKTWREKNGNALHAILISCEDEFLSFNNVTDSAKDVWYQLIEIFQGSANQFGAGGTVLLVAVATGHLKIVEKLVEMMSPEAILARTTHTKSFNLTPLHYAARSGYTKIAEVPVKKNNYALRIRDTKLGLIPVAAASWYGHKVTTRYLYAVTMKESLIEGDCISGAALLTTSIWHEMYGKKSGPALQMQLELQWFQEVEKIVPLAREFRNSKGLKPHEVFTEEHKDLVREGEKWMKDTANSCMVVATLIATFTFAAAFTVPGGFDQDSGFPILLHHKLFYLFIMSDALSLFSSSTSVLMFLSIYTSRYAEEDFLELLPKRLIIGLSTLFFSIATMMVTFCATLFLILNEKHKCVSILITFFAGVPVTVFVLLQFPLFLDMVISTYRPGLFNRPKDNNLEY
ncbi:ankyrin repeat-containing protein ITN1-like [Macadamia integrifolia]|uniref:ankyrin repeat-containing protein ITN1-like n=1 Tax=Macadamia integrifolia TaxID=60698 RepID=UPI001C5309A4|nr:ankyrin repeat-containing protein ITN1-like [Macadamia integrifolia]